MSKSFSAIRLPRHIGVSGWNEILPKQDPAKPLESDISCDFAVIGAGFAGLCAARRLRQLNGDARIVLLDAGRVGEGAAGRNSGFMIDLPHVLTSEDYAGQSDEKDQQLIRLNRMAIRFASEAVEEYEVDRGFFDPAGKINGAASTSADGQNRSYAVHLDKLNEPYEIFDAQAMFELTGSRHYMSGLYTPGTVLIQPAGYVRGLATGLSATMAIYENTPVTGFKQVGVDWKAATPKGAVTAHRLILANNGHLESFGFMRRRLMHVFLYATMTKTLDLETLRLLGGGSRWGITPSNPMGTTLRKIDSLCGGDRIITRTCASFHPGMETSEGQLARAKRVMRRKFDDRFPNLAGFPMEYAWSGHICLSMNSVSVARELEEGVYVACCQNGLGATRGTLTGIAAAEGASGVSSEIRSYFEAEAQPSRLPPEPLSTIGANVVLRWKEWKARQE